MDNRNCLTWEEYIRLLDTDHPQILRMQNTIIKQQERIAELESEVKDKTQLLNSFDFETIEYELNMLGKYFCPPNCISILNITKVLDNIKLRI